MTDILEKLYQTIEERKAKGYNPEEKSYTYYLFSQGEDKILKKCGEECAEMIIAAKNNNNKELCAEISDLLYHILVLCVEKRLPLGDIYALLEDRHQKTGNLKEFKIVDKNT